MNELLTILAVLLAPLLALQAQKRVEIFREERGRKIWVFKTLMATRANNVSAEHVQALNMIDLEFRGRKYKAVTDTWKAYLDHLASYPREDETVQKQWSERRIDRLATLLIEMGNCLGYEFDEVHIKKGVYAPEAHGQIENEQILIRRGLIRLLYGDANLKMDIQSFPVTEDEALQQKYIREALLNVLKGENSISIVEQRNESENRA